MKRTRGGTAEPPGKEQAQEPAHDQVSAPPGRLPGNRFVRWAINLWVLLHFTAVLAAAGSVGETSELMVTIWRPFRPYLQALCLNHGYNFFAPQPAPSTLLNYEVEFKDGTMIRGRILDRSMKPRLLYHRYLLLTEHLVFVSEEAQKHWYKSYGRHLCRKYGGARVSFFQVIHYPATMEMIRNGSTLDEPFSYEEKLAGEFACGEL